MSPKANPRTGPLYVQIADSLRAKVGELDSGSRIPSEPKLAKDWGVSRFTVAKAVEQLVDEGLIVRRQGSGTFVAEAPLRRAPGYLLSFTEAVQAAGHAASQQLLCFGEAQWRPGLPYPETSRLMLLDRLRLVDGRAVARHCSILCAELLEQIGLTDTVVSAPDFSLYRFFERNGLQVSHAQERLVACLAGAEDRALLNLPDDAVVVAVTRHSFAADGTPLDAVEAIYDARRYSYEARLVREHQDKLKPSGENSNEDVNSNQRGQFGSGLVGPWSGPRDGG